jgi:hypothetical protein
MTDANAIPEPDPADVAASGTAAATLLGRTDPTPGQAPTSGVPTLPTASSVPSTSRYAGVDVATWVGPDGVERPYLRRRLIPQPDQLATSGWEMIGPGDRLDLVASRALGDGRNFWQLCDANVAFDPAELEEPGRRLRVTLPEGFPGAQGGSGG